jgi:ATP-dependent NAD(P)H-hydrate dehydratase
MLKYAREALLLAKSQGMFIVIDADGLYMIGKDLSLVKGYRRAVLTPNVVEFKRLSEAAGIDKDASPNEMAGLISRALGGVTILQKGASDIIANDTTGEAADKEQSKIEPGNDDESREKIEVDVPGGLKRCGGQGDILSGNTGAMLAWAKCYEDGAYGLDSLGSLMCGRRLTNISHSDHNIPSSRMPILAATGASMVTRAASRRAFLREGRGVVTADMLGEIGGAFANIFGEDMQGKDESKL